MNRNLPFRAAANRRRLLAELDWLARTPDLILPPASIALPETLHRAFNIQDIDLVLDTYEPRWRLGEHFERIVHIYLKNNDQVIDIYNNIQVKRGKQTLGELDFLLQLEDRWVHLEVALKLYLLDGKGDGLSGYIGTRRDDCLEAKWERMLNHQLPLCDLPEAKERLSDLGLTVQPQSAAWVKGWLFYHPKRPLPASVPAPVNPSHLRGWWLAQSELELLMDYGTRFMLVRKPDWLLPPGLTDADVLNFDELMSQVDDLLRASLVLVVRQEGERWVELSRGFVVPDSWSGGGP